MLDKSEIFKLKINFIFEKISNKNLDKFTELFWIEEKTTFENRRYNLKKNWLKKATVSKNFTKEYERYHFSSKNINGKKLFRDADDFLNSDLDDFKQRIQAYIDSKNRVIAPKDLDYKYLYTFSEKIEKEKSNIDYYQLKYLNSYNGEVDIEVIAPKSKKSLNIKPYKGTLKLQKNKIILSFSNNEDYISTIFNVELTNRHTKFLVGVGLGILDNNEKIPISKKVILTKEFIENVEELYLILNETERILAEENTYKFKHEDRNFISSHIEKYVKKIEKVDTLFKELSNQGLFPSFYEQLTLKEFSATKNILQKFQKNQSFYIHYRKRILDILIKSHKSKPYKKLYMVMPIYKDENIFEQQTDQAIKLQNEFKNLSNSIDIEIVFVLKECNRGFSDEFITFLEEASSSMKIHFILKEKIEYGVDSIDFIFTDNSDFVITKSLRTNITTFQLYLYKNTIDDYHAFFRKIVNRSISYKEFVKDKYIICNKKNPLLKILSGEWYNYAYGSKRFWEDKVKIFEDGRVEYHHKLYPMEIGTLINKDSQSIILLDDPITKNLFAIIFDHQAYQIQKAFFTKNIAKQLETNLDIFTIGILSRKKIPIEKAKWILGSREDVTFLEKHDRYDKLSDYLVDN